MAQPALPYPSLDVLYEDNHVIAVYKPHGLLTQGDWSKNLSAYDWVKGYLKMKYQKPGNVFLGLVHRLDRPVDGVLIFARTSKAASRLSESIRDRQVQKIYRAEVEGNTPTSGELRGTIGWSEQERRAIASSSMDAKPCALSFVKVETKSHSSVLEIQLETGRKHQIRFQLSQIGHPVVGDVKYGARPVNLGTIALSCLKMVLPHPVKGELLSIQLPEKFLQ